MLCGCNVGTSFLLMWLERSSIWYSWWFFRRYHTVIVISFEYKSGKDILAAIINQAGKGSESCGNFRHVKVIFFGILTKSTSSEPLRLIPSHPCCEDTHSHSPCLCSHTHKFNLLQNDFTPWLFAFVLSFFCLHHFLTQFLSLCHSLTETSTVFLLNSQPDKEWFFYENLLHLSCSHMQRRHFSQSIPWLLSLCYCIFMWSPAADYHCLLHCQNFLLPLSHSESHANIAETHTHTRKVLTDKAKYETATWKLPDMYLCTIVVWKMSCGEAVFPYFLPVWHLDPCKKKKVWYPPSLNFQ